MLQNLENSGYNRLSRRQVLKIWELVLEGAHLVFGEEISPIPTALTR